MLTMMKKNIHSLTVGLCLLLTSALLTESNAAVITGRVMNATRDSVGVRNVSVYLLQFKSGETQTRDLGETRTSARGVFRFTVQSPDTTTTYFAAVDYLGVRYFSHGTHFHGGADKVEQNVVVYDTTNSAANVEELMHHVFIDNVGRAAQLREMHILNIPGKRTLINAITDDNGQKATFKFDYPINATRFTGQSDHAAQVYQFGRNVFVRGYALPGTRQIAYSYEIPWQKNTASVSLGVSYPTRTMDIFISNPKLILVSDQLQDLGPFTIRDVKYRRYGAENLTVGSKLSFRVVRMVNIDDSPLATIVLTSFLLIAGLLFSFYQSDTTTLSRTEKQNLQNRKSELIQEIARLDVDPETEKNAELQQTRQELFAELESIEKRLRGTRADSKSKRK